MHNRKCFENHIGPWAVWPQWFHEKLAGIKAGLVKPRAMEDDGENAAERARREDLAFKAAGASKIVRDENFRLLYVVQDGVGVARIDGAMAKFDGKYTEANTVRIRQAVRQASADPDVGALVLRIDSPGGNVAGTAELAADVKAAADAKPDKPVWAYIEDLGASAAYWVASQADKIFANEMALIGSIGTYAVVDDASKAYEMAGIKTHVISTGPYKGSLIEGSEVLPEHLNEVREIVEGFNSHFLAAVSAGRGMDRKALGAVTDGRVWIASEAKRLGLVDQVTTWDAMFADARDRAGKKLNRSKQAEALTRLAEEI